MRSYLLSFDLKQTSGA